VSVARDLPLVALSRAAGIDLGAYREGYVAERVRRALEREGAGTVGALVRRLTADPAARVRFRSSVAVSVSGLFRDPAQFDLLERELLPPLLADGRRVTVWSSGCADGSELYSVAILLERLGALERAFLFGTDLLEENLAAARRGVYGEVTVPEHLQARAHWERRDLVRDGPPAGKWRLVLCRNVAIYLEAWAKRRLFGMLAGSLGAGGVLLLGRSERLSDPASLGLERAGPHAYRRVA
jgi:chemotaxis protein methyltransferase CheR